MLYRELRRFGRVGVTPVTPTAVFTYRKRLTEINQEMRVTGVTGPSKTK